MGGEGGVGKGEREGKEGMRKKQRGGRGKRKGGEGKGERDGRESLGGAGGIRERGREKGRGGKI